MQGLFTPLASRQVRLAAYGIVLLSALVYLPSLDGLALWDDRALIGAYRNLAQCFDRPFLQHYFRPVVSLTFFLEWRLWGRDAFFCHRDNLLIHVATTSALIVLLRDMFRERWIAVTGGLLFAVQPAQVSTVAWIGGRTDSLCTLWLTLFMWTLVRSVGALGARAWVWTALSTAFFGLALLTKEQAIAALPIVPAVYLQLGRRIESSRRNQWTQVLLRTLPFLTTSVLFLAFWFHHYPNPRTPQHLPMDEQFRLAGQAAVYYILLFLAPTSRFMHMLTLTQLDRCGWPAIAGLILMCGAGWLLVRLWRTHRACSILLLYTLLTYLPVSNLAPMPSLYAAPYRVGICGAAIAGLMAAGLTRMFALSTGRRGTRKRITMAFMAVAFALWCTCLTVTDNRAWLSQQILFAEFHEADPGNIPTTCQYCRELVGANRPGEAVRLLQQMLDGLYGSRVWRQPAASVAELATNRRLVRALRLQYGSSEPVPRRLSGIFTDLSSARWSAGDRAGAGRALRSAMNLDPGNPYANLVMARAAYSDRRYREAYAGLRISIAGQPERFEAHKLMVDTLLSLRRWREAEIECQACIELEPWRSEPYVRLAFVRSAMTNRQGAEQALRQAISNSEGDHIEERRALAEYHPLSTHGSGGPVRN